MWELVFLPEDEGGYGTRLGKRNGIDLSKFLKIKLKKIGLRVVYTIIRKKDKNNKEKMLVIVIGARADNELYEQAKYRVDKHNLK